MENSLCASGTTFEVKLRPLLSPLVTQIDIINAFLCLILVRLMLGP